MTNEVLQQFAQIVSDILDTKLKTELQPIKDDMRVMKAEMAVMKADIKKLQANVDALNIGFKKLQSNVDTLNVGFEELQRKVTSIGLHVENETDKYIRIVAENHIELSRKLDRAIPAAEKQSIYEMKVDYLEKEVNKVKKDVTLLKQKMA